MRTRNQSKLQNHSIGKEEEEAMKPLHQSGSQTGSFEEANEGTLNDISREAVGKLLKRVKKRGSRGLAKEDSSLRQCNSIGKLDSGSTGIVKQVIGTGPQDVTETEGCRNDKITNSLAVMKVEGESSHHAQHDGDDEMDDSYWEDGSIPNSNSTSYRGDEIIKGVTIEFDASPDLAKRKPVRRASAEDKEVAELVHKVHLLCLLGRGRLIDSACNDPLIQACLLSLLPPNLLKIADVPKLTAKALAPLVSWFHNNFRTRNPSSNERSFHSALALALETHEGTPEEVAALSVALFRALNLTTRFVYILDVASLKPDADYSEFSSQDSNKAHKGIFNSSTLMVARQHQASASPVKDTAPDDKDSVCETSLRGSCISKFTESTKTSSQLKNSAVSGKLSDAVSNSLAFESQNDKADMCLTKETEGLKRKGDLEFEMQLEMALSATALVSTPTESNMGSVMEPLTSNSSNLSPLRKMKKLRSEETSSSHGISTAFGSRKVGAPLYWAEVYCGGENLTGKWVHVDAINAIVDGEHKVETAAAACKLTLRYVVAFAGHGAKDVTRRYCMKWYKIASQRINSMWWDAVLAPLKGLESGATGGMVQLKQEISKEDEKGEMLKSTVGVSKEYGGKKVAESSMRTSFSATRSSLEDMELETRALTEPLPTNQQAYRNHQLYAIERWLTKYQILYPKGPVLGFCSGHPVYLRTCVQTLHTKIRWLREGMQVKANELPAKVLNRSSKLKAQIHEAYDSGEESCEGTVALYGKWQTEPLCLPPAVDGIVPKNERGQVDVWSEKCLPPGTVHLRLPRVASVAKRLEIDFAPAMVGFEFRNGKSMPVFDGIVVCAEFKDVILEAYAEEEELRQAKENRRSEAQALSRWYQLLSSLVTRQKLNECYGDGESSQASISIQKADNDSSVQVDRIGSQNQSSGHEKRSKHANKPDSLPSVPMGEHEHVFLTDDMTFDEESLIRTKRCHCGFSIQVEEL